MFRDLIEEYEISLYELSKKANVPYSTLSNIKLEKTDARKISSDTLYRLSKYLNISMEKLYLKMNAPKRMEFELFKSEARHELKRKGDTSYILYLLEEDIISIYWELDWQAESLYLLAMLDYLSKRHNTPICNKYDYYRTQKLANILYPKDILLMDKSNPDRNIKEEVLKICNPEFLKYNIVEVDLTDVV
ncbi:MAG: helix-turn-helix transcriptional regulator [Lachnospiraceae bacterium]|nr:helix-turn-helix transcriptional regulator [Lachnospiraceae bacterium]